jgi:hypothetical protein
MKEEKVWRQKDITAKWKKRRVHPHPGPQENRKKKYATPEHLLISGEYTAGSIRFNFCIPSIISAIQEGMSEC